MKFKLNPKLYNKAKAILKWMAKEAVSGIVIAAAVAVATSLVTAHQELEKEQRRLETIYLGLNRPYIESLMGPPIVDFVEEESLTTRAYYKQPNSVLICSYADEQLVAYFVVVNSDKRLYRIPYNFFTKKDVYLSNFTYWGFSQEVDEYSANCPANNDDYAYYYETYYGAAATEYNYLVIGSYKNYYNIAYTPLIAHSMAEEDQFYASSECVTVRQHARPNVFGMIAAEYIDAIHMIPDVENLRTYNHPIFSGWY